MQACLINGVKPLARFGHNLRECRLEVGLSQERLALEAELNRSYVGQVERGERNISILNVVKLARAIGCTASRLVAGLELDEDINSS